MLLVTALDAAQATVLENGELYVQFAPDSRYEHAKLSENTKFLADACREVTGQETRVRIQVKDARAENESTSKEDEKQRLREMAESSPAVKQALKTFRGEIVDVRRANPDRKSN
jgi:hypothetical protein